jgi:peptidoglycan/xylan/chitin deacetylase (PgdA/CDA1 family)
MRLIITVDDLGALVPLAQQERALAFWEGLGLRATLFCVPRSRQGWRADQAPEWCAFARRAREAGHDLQLHGLDHAAYEFGPTPVWMRALGGAEEEERFQRIRAERESEWRVARFVPMLRTAREIFAAAVGQEPQVFRSGALSQCAALYEALAEVGVRYASNLVVNPRGWEYITGKYDSDLPWDPAVPPCPFRMPSGIVMLPIISEYAWYVPEQGIVEHVALARADRRRVREAGGVFLLVCHAQCVGAEEGYAREILRRMVGEAREEGEVEFGTVRELVEEIEAGAVEVRGQGGGAE